MVYLKNVKKIISADPVEKMMKHFENYKFVRKINDSEIQFGFHAESLKECVRKEWVYSNVVASDWPAFLFSYNTQENLKTNWEEVRSLVSSTPFSLVEMFNSTRECGSEMPVSTNAATVISNQFKKQSGTVLRNHCFCMSDDAVNIFHKKQRDRKNWWRKFSAFPGRFKITNINTKEYSKSMVCEIQAEFPWGIETVETIKYLPELNVESSLMESLQIGRKRKSPEVVLSESLLEKITFTFLCDSYEQLDGESERDVLMLDRKLAPFKVAIAGSVSSSEDVKSLEEVCLLLAKQIRKLGIPVLFLPDACTTAVEKQVLRNDALGVPYTLLFNDRTVREGILGLRNRNTTLEESSHVSLITEYLGKLIC